MHTLINLHNQTASKMEQDRQQSQTETRNILNSILNATVAKDLRVEQDVQSTGDSSGHWETPKGKPCLLDSTPTDTYKKLEQEWGAMASTNGLELMETEPEEDQEHANYQSAMYKVLLDRSKDRELCDWIPMVQLHRLVSAKGNYPKATLRDIFAVGIHEISKGQRFGDTVFKLFNMPWKEQGDGMNYNITFIRLGKKQDNPQQGWENYKKRSYQQYDGWASQ